MAQILGGPAKVWCGLLMSVTAAEYGLVDDAGHRVSDEVTVPSKHSIKHIK